jgi:hypothetical protein
MAKHRIPQFQLKKETVQRLGLEELSSVIGGGLAACTAVCCSGCDTEYTLGGSATACPDNCNCCHDMASTCAAPPL